METPEPFKITLKNGDEVKVNDHVYCSPSWGVRDGTPYSIARIMEFLPALGTPTVDPKTGRRNEPITRVRLAWYYRPGDVSDRAVADSRLLLAAIYSEVCELAQLRERCFVHHRDRISDLAGWKKRPDRFYFTRLFDPWLRKEFEVIPATTVRNVPAHIRDVLVERYEYIVAEREVVPDLTDDIRLCETCEKWCPPAGSLQCDGCKKYFHMECVTPPMLSKPARGYGWTCAPCARLHEEKVEGHSVQAAKAKTGAPSARGRGRPRKDKSLAEKEENVEIKHFKMWPFRYFGLYTFAEDTLDPDDLIFPRAATRVGPKFQATVPPTTGTDDRPKDVEERGGDATIEVLSLVNEMDEQDAANYEKQKDMLTRSETLKRSVDWLTEVTFRLTDAWLKQRDFATVSMRSPMRLQKFNRSETRYTEKDWAPDEVAAFEDAIQMHGAELRAVREEVSTRTMPEVVRFYGHWKSAKVGEENARIRAARAAGLDVKSSSPAREASPEEEEGSVIVEMRRGHPSCGACRTRESALWWKAPKGLATTILCESCGPSWRKYADLNVRPVREEAPVKVAKAENKREGTPLAGPSTKRAKTVSSQHSTPPPPPPPSVPQLRCVACQKNGPEGKVLRCKQCQFRVHASACGFPPASTASDAWMCDLCENEQSPEASLISDCMLCPRMWRDPKKKLIYPPPDTFLRACKPTEGQAWVHVLCSVFVPEITYSDAAKLKLVEGISAILEHRWQHKCSLCDRDDGAVVQCSECPAEFHVSCAWKQGHKFGFEMQQAKGRRETMPVVEFKGASGVLVPTIICKGHTGHKRVLVDLCEPADASGAAESALQLYCRAYKQAPVSETHALLRKAMRLDRILEEQMARLRDLRGRLYNAQQHPQSQQPQQNANGVGPIVVDVPIVDADPPEPEPHCYRCRTQFSPLWHELAGAPARDERRERPRGGAATAATATNGAGRAWMCHKCHASNRQAFPVMIGIATS